MSRAFSKNIHGIMVINFFKVIDNCVKILYNFKMEVSNMKKIII